MAKVALHRVLVQASPPSAVIGQGALMAVLFALGIMSVAWMAFVAALIAIEKLAPWKTTANRAIAVTLVVLGMAVAVVPEQVPGLTVPTSAGNGMTMEAS